MLRLNLAPARSEAEVDEAFQLALGIFSEHSESINYPDIKASLWRDDPHHRPDNVLLARASNGRLVGLIRVVPRIIYRAHQALTVAGLSSVCVHPEFRGQGYSAEMMRFAIEHCRYREYDIALLIARRAADHYYTQFGFWGVSSFNSTTIAINDSRHSSSSVKLESWRPEYLGVFAEAYVRCYQATFGYFERSASYWGFLLKKLNSFHGISSFAITVLDKPIGYVIIAGSIVHEIAWTGDLPLHPLISALQNAGQFACATDRLSANVSPAHLLRSAVSKTDITVSFRECHYGGHMVKILNVGKIAALLAARIQTKLGRLGVNNYYCNQDGVVVEVKDKQCSVTFTPLTGSILSYSQTCLLLGAYSFSSPSWDLDEPQPFNVALADQF